MPQKRLLLITQWFDPEPTFKGQLFARELVKLGFDVEVLTGFPNYPGGKVYPGYRIKWLQREVIDGVRVTRVPLFPSHNQSPFGRILNYVTFAVSATIYGIIGAKKADVIYAYHPPLTVGFAAVLIRFFRQIPVVYDIQDMWPDTLRATGMLQNPFMLRVVSMACQWVYKNVDQIVVLSPGFRKLLIDRNVPDSKIEIIYNWADETAITSNQTASSRILLGPEGFRILFAGNMGKAQSLESVLVAAKLLQEKGSRIQFVFLGGGIQVASLKTTREKLGLQNVHFFPPVPMSEVGAYLKEADALLVHLRKDPLFEITIPSKTQAYMTVSKPILMAVGGDASDLINRSGGGVSVEPENPEAIAMGALQLEHMSAEKLKLMGDKAGRYYQDELSVGVGVLRFDCLFKKIINRASN